MKRLLYLSLLCFLLISCTDLGKNQLQIAQSYLDTYPDSTLIYLEEIDPSELSSKVYMEYLLTMTQARHKTGQDISNDTLLFAYKDQFRKLPAQKAAWCHFYTAKVYQEQVNIDQAITEYMACEKLLKDDLYLTGMLHAAYGDLYRNKLELEDAILYYKQSVEVFLQIKQFVNASICYNHIGNSFLYQHNLDSAFFYYDKCIQYQKYWTPVQEAILLSNLALAYSVSGQNEAAVQYLEQALNLPLDNSEKAKIYAQLAEIYADNPNKFLTCIQQGIDILLEENTNILLLSQLYRELSYFHVNNDIQAAFRYYQQYHQSFVSAIKKQYNKTIKELRQENHIRHLHAQNLRLTIIRQYIILISIALFVLIVLIAVIIFYKYNQNRKELLKAGEKIETLQDMATKYQQQEGSLRNIVLRYFDVLKKVSVLEYTLSHKKGEKALLKAFNRIVYQNDTVNWEAIYNTINTLHGDLFDKIQKTFPQLKESEYQICCLTIAQFSNIEISVILNYTLNSIQVKKSRIRKKIGIEPMGNISTFFETYFQNR